MSLIRIVQELLAIYQDTKMHEETRDGDFELYDFNQVWGSTALGFPGMGGQAITAARTYVIIPNQYDIAFVYFAGRFAYTAKLNDAFKEDLRKQRMVSVMESGKYKR